MLSPDDGQPPVALRAPAMEVPGSRSACRGVRVPTGEHQRRTLSSPTGKGYAFAHRLLDIGFLSIEGAVKVR